MKSTWQERISESGLNFAICNSEDVLITRLEDAMSIIGQFYYEPIDGIILFDKNIVDAFFDLKSKLAGDILQKFTQYQIKLAIVGDFDNYSSKSLKQFISESNAHGQIVFTNSLEGAISKLS